MAGVVGGRLSLLMRRVAVWVSWRLVDVGFALTLVATVCAFAGRRHWAMDLVANGRPQFFVLSVGVGLLFLWGKRRTAAVLAGACALMNFIAMAHYFGSAVEKKVEGQPVFRLLSANVYQLSGPERDYKMIEPILDEKWELAGLQESGFIWRDIMPSWKGNYPQQSIDVSDAFHHELSFLGSADPKWKRVWTVPLLDNDLWSRGLTLEMEWQGKTVSVLTAHSYRPSSAMKLKHISEWQQGIVKWVKEKRLAGHAVIVMGDFNCTPWTHLYQNFVKELGLREAGRGNPFSATWMREWPHRMMIDHVFVSDEWRVVNWRVGPDFDSDHRPVMVELQLR